MDWITPVLTVATGWITLGIGWKVLKPRLFGQITRFANEYIASLIQDAIENPEKLAPLLDALTKQGMKSLGVTKEQSLPGMKMGGFKVPGWLLQMAMPVVQKQLAKGATGVVEEAAKSAFHS